MSVQRLADLVRGWWPSRVRRLGRDDHDRILAGARREQHGRLAALFLAGSPYEMGYQHGVLARDLIHGFRQDAYNYVLPQVPGPALFARPLLLQYSSTYWPTVGPEFVEEMRGVADGAGVHPVEVLLSTAIWEIFHTHGCSQFAAIEPVTRAGKLIHGYNYDLMDPDHALIQPYLAAIFYRPTQGIPFVTVNTAGSVGVNGGMNEAGISVAWDNTYLGNTQLTAGLPTRVVAFIITLRRLLQYSATIEEAIAVVTGSLPRPLADIVIIGSAREGRAVALETAGRAHSIRELAGKSVWSTNCFRSAELAVHDRRGDGAGLTDAGFWRRFPRYSAYRELFARHQGKMTAATAAAFLRDPYPRERSGYLHPLTLPRTTICRDITSWSLIMDPGAGRFWASDTRLPAAQGQFLAFDLRERSRLDSLDIPGTGYHAATQSAIRFLNGDHAGCLVALDQALGIDGASAPLLLVRALINGLEGDESQAVAGLDEVESKWPSTPASALAVAWKAGSQSAPVAAIPFPSAIRPLLHLVPAGQWKARAVPVAV